MVCNLKGGRESVFQESSGEEMPWKMYISKTRKEIILKWVSDSRFYGYDLLRFMSNGGLC
jgi:hypothetical protein